MGNRSKAPSPNQGGESSDPPISANGSIIIEPRQRFWARHKEGYKAYGHIIRYDGDAVEVQFTEPDEKRVRLPANLINLFRRPANLGDLARDDKSRFAWDGWFTKHINILSSDPKIGKTFLMLDIARYCLAIQRSARLF